VRIARQGISATELNGFWIRHGWSLNQVAVEALTLAAGLAEERPTYHDLDHLAGTWVDDPEFDAAVQAQDQVDAELWR